MNYNLNFKELVKRIPLHSLMNGTEESWVTNGLLNWVIASGSGWVNSGGNKHGIWLGVLVTPIQSLHSQFLSLISSTRYRMQITGQVVYLEHYLNDLFDANERRIYISDAAPILAPFVFQKIENQPENYIYQKSENADLFYLRVRSDFGDSNDFIINVPSAITLTEELQNKIKAATNLYKQAGSRFAIENY